MIRNFLRFSLPLVLLAMTLITPVSADMLISPTRAYMDENNRSATLVLRNTAQGARTYRLVWEDKRVNEAGNYEPVAEGSDFPSAADMVRFSPRQITVGPGENQTVRLNFRPPAGLAAGEYRSHLKLQVVEEESEPAAVMQMDDKTREGVSFRIFMQMSFSIPVIARYNVPAPDVAISNVSVVPPSGSGNTALEVMLKRSGPSSSYGNLVVEMQKDANSPVELIGRQNDLYVFPETDQKSVRVSLRDRTIPAGAWIRVAYEGIAEYEGRLWDEQVFQSR